MEQNLSSPGGEWKQLSFSSWVFTGKPIHIFCSVCNLSLRVKFIEFLIKLLRVGTLIQNQTIAN